MILILFSINVYSQGVDCNGFKIQCSRTKKYPYYKCPSNGEVICKSYNDKPLTGVYRAPFRICYSIDNDYGYIPPQVLLPAPPNLQLVEVFRDTKLQTDRFTAQDEIACICGLKNNSPCNCIVKLQFSTKATDFIDPTKDLAITSQIFNNSTCILACDKSVTQINNTPEFRGVDPSKPTKFYFNGDIAPIVASSYVLYSIIHILEHEMLHLYGLAHYDNKGVSNCDPSNGIMNAKVPNKIGGQPRNYLSADDRCAFAILYCVGIVPVEEDLISKINQTIISYPSPVSDILNIQMDEISRCAQSYYIVDIDGRIVKRDILTGTSILSVSTSYLTNGTYYMVFTDSNFKPKSSLKFIVNH